MKIIKSYAGALTNFEVLDFLRSRGASTDPTRVIAAVGPSEFQVYDYLLQSAACNQTRESVNEFLKKCEKFDLAKAEKLNIINIRPSSEVEIDPSSHARNIQRSLRVTQTFQGWHALVRSFLMQQGYEIIEQCDSRMGVEDVEELVKMVVEVLPPPPAKPGETDDVDVAQNQELMETN